ncbi:MAG: right-handed parallel beta-helix repeat-containing protein [Thermoplasmatales archaeon]|nr:right-handed parallel beta-helix repeat-containing protein [Thermoplasmatales archaeon]
MEGNNLIKKGVVVAVILLFISVSAIPSTGTNVVEKSSTVSFDGNTLYVGGSGPNNYTKIQDAIDNASDGDTVFVYNGTYYENVNIGKTINLVGEDKNTTIINAGGNGVHISIDHVIVERFTITNVHGYPAEGISVSNSKECRISKNIFKDDYIGISVKHSSELEISYNNIEGGTIGIDIQSSNNNIIKKNNIYSSGWKSIDLRDSSNNNIVIWNVVHDAGLCGIIISGSGNNIIYRNELKDNYIGINIVSRELGIKNKVIGNNFFSNGKDAIFDGEPYTRWLRNYWNEPKFGPKIIKGRVYLIYPEYGMDWYNFDWFPALRPYNIEV